MLKMYLMLKRMDLEAFINEANKYYDVNNIALIYKNLPGYHY